MNLLIQLTRWEVLLFLLTLAGIVIFRLLTGEINTRYLLYGRKRNRDRYFSPERVQLLVFTISAAFYYLTQLLEVRAGKFPELPESWVAVIGGSNAVYLGGKAYARWFARKN